MAGLSSRRLVVQSALIGVVLLADVITVGTGVGQSSSSQQHLPTATPSASPIPPPDKAGILLFSDDFKDSGTGWANVREKSGSSFRYSRGKYVAYLKDSSPTSSSTPQSGSRSSS